MRVSATTLLDIFVFVLLPFILVKYDDSVTAVWFMFLTEMN